MALEVIGAGFGRTGTMSLKLALQGLGLDPCYHMSEVMQNPHHDAVWLAATRRETVDWDALFEGFRAAVDWPAAAFWPELAVFYPQAKFILTERDPEAWYRSMSSTIFPMLESPPGERIEHREMTRELILERTFGGRHEDKDHVIETFLAHNRKVRESLPPERLLVYETGSGWEPICQFLGLPVPVEDFPHTNTTQEFQRRLRERMEGNA